MARYTTPLLLIAAAMAAAACRPGKGDTHPLEYYRSMAVEGYALPPGGIKAGIAALAAADSDNSAAARHTKTYYANGGRPLWVSVPGVHGSADSVLAVLAEAAEYGLDKEAFGHGRIAGDMAAMRTLAFPRGDNAAAVAARLEYNLTKACLAYSAGQGFGFSDPSTQTSDSGAVASRRLFDIPTERPGEAFFKQAIDSIRLGRGAGLMRSAAPASPLFGRLKGMLARPGLQAGERRRILCNMERCRWRTADSPEKRSRYVLVNIPAYRLRMVQGDSAVEMRVGCGAAHTKTPMLAGLLKRMDFNPQWIIPQSIVERGISAHAGNAAYFARKDYMVVRQRDWAEQDPGRLTREDLESGAYRVVQRGGPGNPLGRVIFRFDNSHAIYLHDTSTRHFFQSGDRGVSHGCIRVERPRDLALFLLQGKAGEYAEKVGYTMAADVFGKEAADTLDRRLVVRSLPVEPRVPVFILYHTLYPAVDGTMESHPDVYGYDATLYRRIKRYCL